MWRGCGRWSIRESGLCVAAVFLIYCFMTGMIWIPHDGYELGAFTWTGLDGFSDLIL